MVYCSECGQGNPDDSAFCAVCGANIFRPAEEMPAEPCADQPQPPAEPSAEAAAPEPILWPDQNGVVIPRAVPAPKTPGAGVTIPRAVPAPKAPGAGVDDFTARPRRHDEAPAEPIMLSRQKMLSAAGFARIATLAFGAEILLRSILNRFVLKDVFSGLQGNDYDFAKLLQHGAYLLLTCACLAFSVLLYRRYARGWDPRLLRAYRPLALLPFAAIYVWLKADAVVVDVFYLISGIPASRTLPDWLYWCCLAVELCLFVFAAELARMLCAKALQNGFSFLSAPARPAYTKEGRPVRLETAAWFAPVTALLLYLEVPFYGFLIFCFEKEASSVFWASFVPHVLSFLMTCLVLVAVFWLFRCAAGGWGAPRRAAFRHVVLLPVAVSTFLDLDISDFLSAVTNYALPGEIERITFYGLLFFLLAFICSPVLIFALCYRFLKKAQAVEAARRTVEADA